MNPFGALPDHEPYAEVVSPGGSRGHVQPTPYVIA